MRPVGESLMRFAMASSLLELRMMNADPSIDVPMSYKDALYLNMVFMSPGCTMSDLARTACVTRPTVSVRVGGMERKGLVRRVRSETDHRVTNVELADWVAAAYETETRLMSEVESRLVERFGRERVEEFSEVLEEASRMLSESHPEAKR